MARLEGLYVEEVCVCVSEIKGCGTVVVVWWEERWHVCTFN